MGIVARQSIFSAFSLLIGFTIGAINQMVLVPYVFEEGWPREMYGLLQLTITLGIVFSQFLNFGSGPIAVRILPRFRSEGREMDLNFYLWVFPLVGMLILGVFFIAAGDWFISILTDEVLMDATYLLLIIFLNSLFNTLFRSLNGYAVASFRNSLGSFFNEVYIRLVQIAGVVLFAMDKLDFHGLFMFYSISFASQFLFMFLLLRGNNLLSIKYPANKEEFKELTGFGFYSVLDQGAGILVNRIDVLMIGALVGLSEVVYYQMAFFMVTVITIPSRALSNVSSAVTSEAMHKEDWKGIRKLFFSNGLIQTLGGGWIFILIWCNLDLVLMMLPPEFSIIRWPLFFLGVSKMFDLFTSINGLIIGFSPYYRYNFYFNIFLLGITIIANLLLIPYYGINGAAIATAFSLLLYNLMKSIFLHKKYGIQPITIPGLLLLGALFISGIIGLAIPDFIFVDMNSDLLQRTIPVLMNIGIRAIIISGSLYAFVYLFGVNQSIREIVPKKFQRFL